MAPAYSATKAYQINYMEALRKKAYKSGGSITVTDIRPGLVDTVMAKGDGPVLGDVRREGCPSDYFRYSQEEIQSIRHKALALSRHHQ